MDGSAVPHGRDAGLVGEDDDALTVAVGAHPWEGGPGRYPTTSVGQGSEGDVEGEGPTPGRVASLFPLGGWDTRDVPRRPPAGVVASDEDRPPVLGEVVVTGSDARVPDGVMHGVRPRPPTPS